MVGLKEVLANHSMTQEGSESGAWPKAMLSQGGELLTQTEDIVRWWKEHFKPTNTSSVEEAESVDLVEAMSKFLEEI